MGVALLESFVVKLVYLAVGIPRSPLPAAVRETNIVFLGLR